MKPVCKFCLQQTIYFIALLSISVYRNSYCQTFAEFQAPSTDWLRVASLTMLTLAVSLALFLYNVLHCKYFSSLYDRDNPTNLNQGVLTIFCNFEEK